MTTPANVYTNSSQDFWLLGCYRLLLGVGSICQQRTPREPATLANQLCFQTGETGFVLFSLVTACRDRNYTKRCLPRVANFFRWRTCSWPPKSREGTLGCHIFFFRVASSIVHVKITCCATVKCFIICALH